MTKPAPRKPKPKSRKPGPKHQRPHVSAVSRAIEDGSLDPQPGYHPAAAPPPPGHEPRPLSHEGGEPLKERGEAVDRTPSDRMSHVGQRLPAHYPYHHIDDCIDDVCKSMEIGLTIEKACVLNNTSYRTLKSITEGDNPKRSDLRSRLSAARVKFEERWLTRMHAVKAEDGMAPTKTGIFLLGAADPARYRERQDAGAAGPRISVQIVTGTASGALDAGHVEARVITQPAVEGSAGQVYGETQPRLAERIIDAEDADAKTP